MNTPADPDGERTRKTETETETGAVDPTLDGLDPDQTVWYVPAHRHTGNRRYHTDRQCSYLTRRPDDRPIHDSPARAIVPHATQCSGCAGDVTRSHAGPKRDCPFCGKTVVVPYHLPCDGGSESETRGEEA